MKKPPKKGTGSKPRIIKFPQKKPPAINNHQKMITSFTRNIEKIKQKIELESKQKKPNRKLIFRLSISLHEKKHEMHSNSLNFLKYLETNADYLSHDPQIKNLPKAIEAEQRFLELEEREIATLKKRSKIRPAK